MNNLKYILIAFVYFYLTYAFPQSLDEPNKMDFYVVDTITIDNPIVFYKPNQSGTYIGSLDIIERLNTSNIKKILSEKDVYIHSFDFYSFLPIKEFDNYHYPDYGNCKFESEYFKDIKGITYRKFKSNPQKFILALINVSYYNAKIATYGEKLSIFKNYDKSLYYKIAFPICE